MSSPSRSWYADNLRAVMTYWDERLPGRPWHRGRTVGRTVYKGEGPDDMIGVMDTRDYAGFVACMRNMLPELIEMTWEVTYADRRRYDWQRKNRWQKIWEVLRGSA